MVTPGDKRYGAECAKTVAALRYFDICIVRACRQYALPWLLCRIGFWPCQCFDYASPVKFAVYAVELGHLLGYVGAVAFAQAPHYIHGFYTALLLEVEKAQKLVD